MGLGDSPGGNCHQHSWAVADSGLVVVGQSSAGTDIPSGDAAFIWDSTNGMRSLQSVLVDEYGLGDILNGWTLAVAKDITPDGRTIIGTGFIPMATWKVGSSRDYGALVRGA